MAVSQLYKLLGGVLAIPTLDLDAANVGSLWQDAAGTVPVTANGDPVGRWVDRYGQTVWSQSTAGNRPTWQMAVLNGYPAARGNGTSQFLSGNAAALNLARAVSGFTMLAVCKYGKAATDETAAFWSINGAAGGTTSRAILQGLNTNVYRAAGRNLDSGGATLADGGTKSTTAFVVQVGLIDYAGGPVRLRVNGTQFGSSSFASPSASPDTASDVAVLFGGNSGGLQPLQGDIARLLCWRRVLTTPEISAWEKYLGAQYGIAVT